MIIEGKFRKYEVDWVYVGSGQAYPAIFQKKYKDMTKWWNRFFFSNNSFKEVVIWNGEMVSTPKIHQMKYHDNLTLFTEIVKDYERQYIVHM